MNQDGLILNSDGTLTEPTTGDTFNQDGSFHNPEQDAGSGWGATLGSLISGIGGIASQVLANKKIAAENQKAAAANAALNATNQSSQKVIPWIIGGAVALLAVVLLARRK